MNGMKWGKCRHILFQLERGYPDRKSNPIRIKCSLRTNCYETYGSQMEPPEENNVTQEYFRATADAKISCDSL